MVVAVDWDGPLPELASAVNKAYYSLQREALIKPPAAGLDRCWTALEQDPVDATAGLVLLNVFRAQWEQALADNCENWHAMICQKRLIDIGLKHGADYVDKATHEMQKELSVYFRRAREQKGVSDSLIDSNPMSAIEQCFYGPDADSGSHRLGALLMATYRPVALHTNVFLAAAFAFRETYGFFVARERDAALDSLDWAESTVQEIQDRLPANSLEGIGEMYLAAAGASERGEFHDDYLELLSRSLAYLPSEGDSRGGCLTRIGLEYKRRGNLAEALDWLAKANATANLRPDTKGVIETQTQQIRFDIGSEASPASMAIPGDAIETMGPSADYVRIMQLFGNQELSGVSPSDEDYVAALKAAPAWFRVARNEGKPRSEIFSQYVVLMKAAASLNDPLSRNQWLTQTRSEALKYLPDADPAALADYETLVTSLALDR